MPCYLTQITMGDELTPQEYCELCEITMPTDLEETNFTELDGDWRSFIKEEALAIWADIPEQEKQTAFVIAHEEWKLSLSQQE